MKRIYLSLAGITMLSYLVAVPVQSTAPITRSLQVKEQLKTQTFFGTILKAGKNFVLSDPPTESRYLLDDTQKASRYEEMMVKVTGTLDITSNMIHVETIQPIA
jgi:Protein of unknown function (DUF5818)